MINQAQSLKTSRQQFLETERVQSWPEQNGVQRIQFINLHSCRRNAPSRQQRSTWCLLEGRSCHPKRLKNSGCAQITIFASSAKRRVTET